MHVIFRGIDDRGAEVLTLQRAFRKDAPWGDLFAMYEHIHSIPEVVRITVDIAK